MVGSKSSILSLSFGQVADRTVAVSSVIDDINNLIMNLYGFYYDTINIIMQLYFVFREVLVWIS